MVELFIVISLDGDWDKSGHWPSIIPWLPWEAGLYGQSLGGREAKGRGRSLQQKTGLELCMLSQCQGGMEVPLP